MKELTNEQIYKKEQKKAKILRVVAPITRWVLLALSIMFLYFAIKKSIGNIAEIINLLDNEKYTGEELKANYDYLLNKYGKWNIGNGGAGFSIEFVNISKALFSGIAITCFILAVACFVASFVFGKWLLPMLAKQTEENAQDFVNIKTLQSIDKNNNN